MAPAALKPQKKKKMDGNKRALSELKTLGHQLLSSRSHINNLPLLLGYISPSSSPQYALESLLSLQSFFTTVLPDLPPLSSKGSSATSSDGGSGTADPELIYQTWVRAKFDEFTKSLIDIAICKECDETLREVVLDTIMELGKIDNKGEFYTGLYHKLLQSIINSPLEVEFLVELLASKYLNYIDVRYFTYISIKQIAKSFKAARTAVPNNVDGESQSNSSEEVSISKMHFILLCIPPQVTSDGEVDFETWCDHEFLSKGVKKKNSKAAGSLDKESNLDNSNQNGIVLSRVLKRMKLKYSKAWMTFLSLPLPLDLYKEVLVTLSDAVIPFMSNPVMLCDFLTKSCDIGGVICVMALSSLFVLMTRHGLEYPNFYEKLYALLVPSIFMAKYRAKFFELLDTCLKSPLLPAYLAAAFTKKLSRLALVVPPSGGMIIIALIHNLLRRHPSINCLIHQEDGDESTSGACEENKQGIDPFKYEEGDPLKSNALRSSLWEMDSLRHHYCPHVSRFVLSLENDLTVRSKVTEMLIQDFSSGSYSTIFREEIRRRVKQVPLAYYKATPTSLFAQSDFPGWSFENEENTEEEKSIEGEEANSAKRQKLGKSH